MKKYIIYIVLLLGGLLLGWLFFGNLSGSEQDHEHELTQTENGMWTCSMHPQIMQPESGDCPICGMDLIPADISADGLDPDQFKMTENALALANVSTIIVGDSGDGQSTNGLLLSGKIEINENASTTQTAHFGGRIEKLYYKSEGEFIKNGALIASIYSPELVTAQNELIEALAIKDAQPELYNAVRNKLKYWKISEEQIRQIEQTKKVIPNFNMFADTSGYIHEVLVEEGNHVKEGAPLFKVANLGTVWANLDVYEQDIKRLKVGQPITIHINAYPSEDIQTKINYIDPMLNSETRTISIRATLVNKDNALKPGMLLTGKVQLAPKEVNGHTIRIPKSAVLWTGKRSVVYVKVSRDEPIFELREIHLGESAGADYIILSGLETGEEIVTNGTFTIDAAAQLQGKKSMMNQKGGTLNTDHEGHMGVDNSETMKNDEDSVVQERLTVSLDFQKQLKIVVDKYILLKEELVADNSEKASKNANNLLQSLEKVDMSLLTNEVAHKEWMTQLTALKSSSKAIAGTSDIKKQRDHFIDLSNNILKSVNRFGINEKMYVQFCPMANNDKGASWLSTQKNIENPYYGASMLNCGNVTKIIE